METNLELYLKYMFHPEKLLRERPTLYIRFVEQHESTIKEPPKNWSDVLMIDYNNWLRVESGLEEEFW